LSLAGFVGRRAKIGLKLFFYRTFDQLAFAGRLLLAGLWGDERLKGRSTARWKLFLTETWLILLTTGGLIVLMGLLTGFLWDVIWFGVLANIGGAENLVALTFSIQLQEVSPILATAVITMGHGVPMTVDLALRKAHGEFTTLSSLGVAPELFLAWPRLTAGLISFPVLFFALAVANLVGLYIGVRSSIALPLVDYMASVHSSLVGFAFLKTGVKCLMVGFCLNFFCLYGSFQIAEGDIRSIPRLARWAMVETFIYSTICVVLITALYD
jgi:ABC-type transporter Mla maintaining outer membrane lipid asymmetry permease subunit MlaE